MKIGQSAFFPFKYRMPCGRDKNGEVRYFETETLVEGKIIKFNKIENKVFIQRFGAVYEISGNDVILSAEMDN